MDKNPSEIIDYIYKDYYEEYSLLTFSDAKSRNMDIERFSEIASRYPSLSSFF